jgi:hypothetical protein
MRRNTVARASIIGAVAVIALIAIVTAVAVLDSHNDSRVKPTPIPTIGQGQMCVAARSPLDSCDGVAQNPTFTPNDTLAYRIVMPFYEDGWIHVTLSTMDGDSPTIVWTGDIQVIPNPYGVWNSLPPMSAFKPSAQGSLPTSFRIEASSAGRVIARTSFDIDFVPGAS